MIKKLTGHRLAAVLAIAGVVLSPHVMADSLMATFQRAQENDTQYQADFYGKQATDERYYQARSALLPQVGLNASRSQISQDIVSSDNEVFDSGSTTYPTTVYGISIEQSLYDYSRWAAFGQAKREIQQAASELEIARQDLFLRVAERYFTALALHENLTFLQAEKTQVQTNLEQVRARFEDGLVREVERLDAEARYLQVEARELDIINRLRDALHALAEITGQPTRELYTLNDELQLQSPSPAQQEWLNLALERNPRLKAAGLAVEVAMQEAKIRRGGHYPTLDLSVNYENDDTQGSLFGGGSQVNTQTIRLGLDIPVYSGGLVSSRVRESVQLINAGQAREEQVRREIERQVASAYHGVVTAIARERALGESLKASERIAESRQVGYESGVNPVLDLLDAQRDLFFARSELASARYDYLTSVLRLKHAAGILHLDDLAEIDAVMSQPVDVVAANHL